MKDFTFKNLTLGRQFYIGLIWIITSFISFSIILEGFNKGSILFGLLFSILLFGYSYFMSWSISSRNMSSLYILTTISWILTIFSMGKGLISALIMTHITITSKKEHEKRIEIDNNLKIDGTSIA